MEIRRHQQRHLRQSSMSASLPSRHGFITGVKALSTALTIIVAIVKYHCQLSPQPFDLPSPVPLIIKEIFHLLFWQLDGASWVVLQGSEILLMLFRSPDAGNLSLIIRVAQRRSSHHPFTHGGGLLNTTCKSNYLLQTQSSRVFLRYDWVNISFFQASAYSICFKCGSYAGIPLVIHIFAFSLSIYVQSQSLDRFERVVSWYRKILPCL